MILTYRTIQKALAQLGYNPGPIDGVRGPLTDSALARWKTTFESRFGTRPAVDTQPDDRSADITPSGAAGELQRAATSYDIRTTREAAEGPVTTVGSAAGTGLVAVLAIGGIAWWLSRKTRGGFRGLRGTKKRRKYEVVWTSRDGTLTSQVFVGFDRANELRMKLENDPHVSHVEMRSRG